MTFDDTAAWFETHEGRRIHVVFYVDGVPLASLDGKLSKGVSQDASVLPYDRGPAPPLVFGIGSATVGLDKELFTSAERVGGSVAVRFGDRAELVAFPWRDEG